MTETDRNTAKRILKAAEEEFVEKGYGNAKMMSIAERAGVSHSMLHYYYRSKENLFNEILDSKMELVYDFIHSSFSTTGDWSESISHIVEMQFDALRENPGFIKFVITDIVSNKENLRKTLELVRKRMTGYFPEIEKHFAKEAEAGKIRPISLIDIILDIAGINITTFLAAPVIKELFPDVKIDNFFESRKRSNAEFITAALRP